MVTNARGVLTLPRRSHPLVRAVAGQWRALTSPARARVRGAGEAVLVACSGGADSSALCVALAAARARFAVAHVVHDLREAAEAERDCEAAAALAQGVLAPFYFERVRVREMRGNVEANARRARYDALVSIARQRGFGYVATAHHAMDNLESLLMTVARGGSFRALGGIRARMRWPGSGVMIIRPMLAVSPTRARELCAEAGWTWAHDASNDDRSGDRVRSALRHRVIPELLEILPGAAQGAMRTSRLAAGAGAVVERAVREAMRGADRAGAPGELLRVERARLAAMPGVLIGEVIRDAVRRGGVEGGGRALSQRTLAAISRVVRSSDTERRVFQLRGIDVVVDAREVCVRVV